MRRLSLFALVSVVACGGSNNKNDTDTTGDTDVVSVFDSFINVTDEAKGNFTGWTSGADFASTDWWTQEAPDAAHTRTADLDVEVQDFETDDPVNAAKVQLWFGDQLSGAPDVEGTSDVNGLLTLPSVPACQPMTYKVTTDIDLDETKTTFKAHNVVDYTADGNLVDDFKSVSKVTFLIIPSLLGVTVEEDKSIIAGTAFDVDGKEIEGAQVLVYVDDEIPESLVVKYFVENFPNRDQPYTSPDGLWVAVNVPAGEVRAEMWATVDGELQLLGATVLTSQADSINIGNIYTGYADGVYYPESCYQ